MNYLVFNGTTYIIIRHLFHNVIVRWWRRQCLLPRSHFISLHLRTRKQLRAHCRDKTQTISIVFGQIYIYIYLSCIELKVFSGLHRTQTD